MSPALQKNPSAIYLSDAHLFFAGYGEAKTRETLARLEDACANHQLVVLNGDIFEFPFSALGFARTAARALSVLDMTLRMYPDTQLHYVIGNHDGDPVFVNELHKLAQRHKNFQVSESHFMLEDRLATHGDLIEHTQLLHASPYFRPQRTWGKLLTVPAMIQASGDASAASRIPPNEWAAQGTEYLSHFVPELYVPAKEIITGHTHVPGAATVEGKTHFNTGTAFDAAFYAPVIRKIDAEAWAEYLARSKPMPILDKNLATKRMRKAAIKIQHRLAEYADQLAEIERGTMSYVDKVMAINDAYNKDPIAR